MKKTIPFPVDLPISQAVIHNQEYSMELAGIVGIDPATDDLASGVEAQTKCIMEEIKDTLSQVGWNMSNIIKSQIFITDLNDFSKINDIYKEYFGDEYPARFVVQVAKLPLGASIEIQCSAAGDSINE